MFRKVFGRKGLSEAFAPRSYAGDTLHLALKAELQRLEFYSPGFGQRAVRYVTTGEDEALLADMAPLARGNLVGSSAYQQVKPSLHDMAGATNLAVASGEIPPGPRLLLRRPIISAIGADSPLTIRRRSVTSLLPRSRARSWAKWSTPAPTPRDCSRSPEAPIRCGRRSACGSS